MQVIFFSCCQKNNKMDQGSQIANYGDMFDVSLHTHEHAVQSGKTLNEMLVKMDELQGVANALGRDVGTTQELLQELSGLLEELRKSFRYVDRVAAHVASVDAAVSALEVSVSESSKEYKKRAIKATVAPLSKWFGVDTTLPSMSKFTRPEASVMNMDASIEKVFTE